MTFAVLASIGTAIGTAASTIGAPVAALAGMIPGVSAGAAATAGTIAGSAALGSASGAALSAATGGDPGQGALMGAVTGGVTAGAGAALGGAGGAAGGVTGSAGQAATAAQPTVDAITQGVASPGFQQAATGIQGAAEVAAAEPAVSAITQGVASPGFQQASQAAANAAGTGGLGSILTGDTAKSIGAEVAKQGLGMGIEGIQNQMASNAIDKQAKQDMAMADIRGAQQTKAAEEDANKMYGPAGGLGGGRGLGMNEGGGVRLREGQFIIPADVVSALGNGSTKAGASFLDDFFAAG